MPSLVTLGSGFSVLAGYPQGLEAQVFDNCGAPQVDGNAWSCEVAEVENGKKWHKMAQMQRRGEVGKCCK